MSGFANDQSTDSSGLVTADLSNLNFGTKKKKKRDKKEDDGAGAPSPERGGARKGGLGIGTFVGFDTSLKKKKAEEMSFNDFLNGTEKGGSDPLSLGVAPNTDEDLFAEQDEDFGLFSSDHAVAKKVSKQKKSLFEEEEDEIDLSSLKTDDLLVSKFLTTETDTANGLISSNPMAENAGAPEDDGNRLAQEIGDDTALNDLEKVTQVTESAPLDLFAVENDKKDDLNILDMLENDMMPSTDNLDDIDAYIQSQSSGGSSGLFD